MDRYNLTKEEYAEFLKFKREKILKEAAIEAQRISEKLAKLDEKQANGSMVPVKTPKSPKRKPKKNVSKVGGKKNSVGWRKILKDILERAGEPITYSAAVEAAIKHPDVNASRVTVQRSVGSNLITYSRGKYERYYQIEKNGRKYYGLKTG